LGKRGPKPIDENLRPRPPLERQIEVAAECGMSDEKIGLMLGIPETTLHRKFGPLLKKARSKGLFSLFASAHELAVVQKNPALLIFLLKTRGGLRETILTETVENESKQGRIYKTKWGCNEEIERLDKTG
jgi:hypothetical protein